MNADARGEHKATGRAPHILIVDDDRRLRQLLVSYLRQNGFRPTAVKDAAQARRTIAKTAVDLAIVDLMMAGEDGISLAGFLHERHNLPMIMLTAVDEVKERFNAFEGGVDDYLTKPFDPQELLYRIKAVLRRSGKKSEGVLKFGDFAYHVAKGRLFKNGRPFALTTAENSLLATLADGKPQSRLHLASALGRQMEPRSIDVHIKRLRDKLGGAPYLRTVRNRGYLLDGSWEEETGNGKNENK